MTNRIGRVHKLGKQNRRQTDMNTNILTFPVFISFCNNTNYKNIDMTVNSSSNNNMSYTSTSGVHEKPDDAIEKEYSKN